jgi:hypothetical protein
MATYYFRSTGTNWGTAGDWSATPSPTYSAGAVPTTADNAVFEAASANCIINTGATRNCVNLTCTSYVGTLTFNTNLAVTGNVALGSSAMSMTGSSTLALTVPGSTLSLSSAGCTCSVPMQILKASGALTVTWGSNWTQSGSFTMTGTSWIWNGNTVTFKNSVAWNVSNLSGTTAIILAPDISTTMNITSTGSPVWGLSSVTINGAGTVNLTVSFFFSGTFTWTAGSVTHTGTITFNPGTSTMNTSGMSFQNGQNSTSATSAVVLTSDLTFTGDYAYNRSATSFNPAGRTVFVGGNLTIGVGVININTVLGAATIVMNGTGTISGSAPNAMTVPLTISTSGTITFSGNINWLRTLTFTSGTIVSNATITCNSASTFTLNAPGFSFATFSTSANSTFTGSEGCTFVTFTSQTAGTTHTFQSTDTYTITSALNLLGTAASALTFRSSSAGSLATVTIPYGASLDVGHVTATDINSSNGRTIWVYKGTIGAGTLNWQQLPTVPKTVGVAWVR